jgi:hypothetical protein
LIQAGAVNLTLEGFEAKASEKMAELSLGKAVSDS